MKEQKAVGTGAEKMVQEQLWRNGYSVKNVSKYTKYNLLVNESIKVETKAANHKQDKEGLHWVIEDIGVKPLNANVLAIVITTPLEDTLIFYCKLNSNLVKSLEEIKLLKGNGFKYNLRVTPDILKKVFTDSPATMFNK
jgi:phosphopantothenoylcysteine synthetase/decarboxylase